LLRHHDEFSHCLRDGRSGARVEHIAGNCQQVRRNEEIARKKKRLLFFLSRFGDALGILNIVSGLTLYLPQLREVIRNKSAGAMSLVKERRTKVPNVHFRFVYSDNDCSSNVWIDSFHLVETKEVFCSCFFLFVPSFNMVKDISNFQVYGPQIAQFILAFCLLSLCVYYERMVPFFQRRREANQVQYTVRENRKCLVLSDCCLLLFRVCKMRLMMEIWSWRKQQN
jgi:hypothetical protein